MSGPTRVQPPRACKRAVDYGGGGGGAGDDDDNGSDVSLPAPKEPLVVPAKLPAGVFIEFEVRLLTGQKWTFIGNAANTTVHALKRFVNANAGIPEYLLRLIYNGVCMDIPSRTLADYGVADKGAIHGLMNLRGD